MASTPANGKGKTAGPGSSLRITPSNNSPLLKPATRSPHRSLAHQSTLALQTVIGTTTSSPNGFSSHDQSKSFAFCAGSAAVLAELDDENNLNQRFFRARPSATSVNPMTSVYNQSTPPSTPDSRARPNSSFRSSANSTSTPTTTALQSASPSSYDWGESQSPRGWSSRERIKAVTSVALSPNGRFLAMGETGYNPRVLIYSTAKDSSPDLPLSILSEHTFGVRSLAFSSNSQYLASLGDVNDGFLFVWAVSLKNGSTKLHSTNKCTSFVRDMCWMGQSLITTGVRHIKVWRLPEPRPGSPSKSRLNAEQVVASPNAAPKALSGRNCLLGNLSDNTFSCVASLSDNEAVIGTDSGALCLLDDSAGYQKLSLIRHMGFGITSLAVDLDQSSIWIGGRNRQIQKMSFDSLRPVPSSPCPPTSPSTPKKTSKAPAITCMGSLSSHLVTFDSTRAIHVYPSDHLDDDNSDQDAPDRVLPAHRDSVLGIRSLKKPNSFDADFFTWSCRGIVHFWDIEGKCRASRNVPVDRLPNDEDEMANELKALAAAGNMDFFVSGDKLGVLRILTPQPWRPINEVRAHGGEITDIAICYDAESGVNLVASSGRDRMIQLFQKCDEQLELIQTLDDHVGAVNQLLFSADGERLLSCSADRTVLIRNRVTRDNNGATAVAYLVSKVITLKTSPVSMTFSPEDSDALVVSTMDRCVQTFDISTGRLVHAFRSTDQESTDAVIMSALTVAAEIPAQSPKMLVGVSSTDKSIRVYDMERDLFLTGEFGHAEGVSDVLLLESPPDGPDKPIKRTLVSVGIDGVVMIWCLMVQPLPTQTQDPVQASALDNTETPVKDLAATKPPIRRILSRTELAGFRGLEPSATLSPTSARENGSPLLVRKTSKTSLSSSLRNGNAPPSTPTPSTTSHSHSRRSPTSTSASTTRSPPVSPRSTNTRRLGNGSMTINGPITGTTHTARRTSLSFPRERRSSLHSKNPPQQQQQQQQPQQQQSQQQSQQSDFGSLNMSTEQVCRTLRAYRKKLHGSAEHPRSSRELERELGLTMRSLGLHSKNCAGAGTGAGADASTSTGDGAAGPEAETETDSSGKENERVNLSVNSNANANANGKGNGKAGKTLRKPHHMPSTPNLGQKSVEDFCRSRALDVDADAGY